MRRTKRHARKRQLRVSPEHSAALRKFANMLEIPAEEFLNWQLEELISQLEEPCIGLLKALAAGHIEYGTPKGEVRVKARVADYCRSRELAIAGKEGAKS